MAKFSRFDAVASFSVMDVWWHHSTEKRVSLNKFGSPTDLKVTIGWFGEPDYNSTSFTLSQMQLVDDLLAVFAFQMSFQCMFAKAKSNI